MSSVYENRLTKVWPDDGQGTQLAFASTGDKATFTPARPVNVVRWGVINGILLDVGAGFTIAADHRVTAGSDTGRVNAAVGTITSTADVAQGLGLYSEASPPFEVDPGEQLVFEVTDAADTAGTGYIWVEYSTLPFVGDSGVTAGSFANRIANMTKVTS